MIRQILTFPNAKEIVNQLDVDVYNSLFHASKIQNEDTSLQVINMLLEKGANPYQKEENRQTILFYLAKEGKQHINLGKAKIIDKLLQTYKYDLNDPDKYNQNPLYWAAKFGRLKVAELLLRHGVNINHLDGNG
jgi:ankyrin repeat protein